jgi:hypothetical protein
MRHPFGGAATTVLVDDQGVDAATAVHLYLAPIGGTEVTDLVQTDGVTVIPPGTLASDNTGTVRAPDGGEFLGPDGVSRLWFDAGRGRVLVLANDLDQRIDVLEATVAALPAGGVGGGSSGGGGTATYDFGTS